MACVQKQFILITRTYTIPEQRGRPDKIGPKNENKTHSDKNVFFTISRQQHTVAK